MAKILLCSEFSYLKSGYSKYYYELAKGFHEAGHEVIELAARGDANVFAHIEYAENSPWKVYLCEPNTEDKHQAKVYNQRQQSHGDSVHGAWLYPFVIEHERPEIIVSLRDYWYDAFILEHELARSANVILSPTVDSFPQNAKWIDYYNRADQLVFYNEWSKEWWEHQTGKSGTVISPAASDFELLDRNKCRRQLGLPVEDKIAFTLMRNQTRKRIPELFEAIAKTDWKLHCHTFYPDGLCWDIPSLLLQYNVSEKILFSYYCNTCKKIDIKHYCGSTSHCKKCNGAVTLPSPNRPIDEETLNVCYNSADYYIQYASSEGFGIPAVEARHSGLLLGSICTSAQKAVVTNTGGDKLMPLAYQRDISNNCFRAIPDNVQLVKILQKLDINYDRKSIKEKCDAHYSWDKTVSKWVSLVESIQPKNATPKQLRQPVNLNDMGHVSNSEFVLLSMKYVANRPDLAGGFMCAEILNDLNNGFKNYGRTNLPYTRQDAYKEFYQLFLEQANVQNQN
jgi:hypothetical protein